MFVNIYFSPLSINDDFVNSFCKLVDKSRACCNIFRNVLQEMAGIFTPGICLMDNAETYQFMFHEEK